MTNFPGSAYPKHVTKTLVDISLQLPSYYFGNHVSKPYKKTFFTQVLKTLIFVFKLIL
jgi:hypothetical protein